LKKKTLGEGSATRRDEDATADVASDELFKKKKKKEKKKKKKKKED